MECKQDEKGGENRLEKKGWDNEKTGGSQGVREPG